VWSGGSDLKAGVPNIGLFFNKEWLARLCLFLHLHVVVNFLFRLSFIFPLFLGMVMYANEFKTKEKQKLTEVKKLTATYVCFKSSASSSLVGRV